MQLAPGGDYYNAQATKEINYTFKRDRCKTDPMNLPARERERVHEWVDFVNQAFSSMGNSHRFLLY
jgi:hypothetical protein